MPRHRPAPSTPFLRAAVRLALVLGVVAAAACGAGVDDNPLPTPSGNPGPAPGGGLTARAFLQQANDRVQAEAPGARFYLLVGHQIDGQGVPNAAAGGYWVASYGVLGTGGQKPTVIAVKGLADGSLSETSNVQALPAGYALKTPLVPSVDSDRAVNAMARLGSGGTPSLVALVRLYSPMEPPYWKKLIYYLGDGQSGAIQMVDSDSGQVLQP